LVEVCPWNLYTYSEVFSNSIWVNGNATITDNTTTAPNGTLTADSIFEQAVNDYQIRGQNYSMVSGQQFTFSIYAKANTRNFFRVLVGNGVLASNQSAYFDLVNVTTTSTSLITSSITSVGNGWCKIVISFTCNATGTDAIYFGPAPNMTSGYLPFVGNASNGVYIWGAQLNIGSTAKPYFPTTDRLNVPRLTYQNGGGGCPSLLLEKQSTNHILYSEDYSQSTWTKTGTAITTNAITSPDGTQNADLMTTNDAAGSVYRIYEGNLAGSDAVCTTSVYFKYGNWQYVFITCDNYSNSPRLAVFDLINNTNTFVSSGYTATITSVGNGWYRCTLTGEMKSDTYAQFGLAPNNSSYSGTSLPNGKTLYIWGTQREQSSYPTSYIPTTSASATRVADACFKTGISSLIGQTEGTIFSEAYFQSGQENLPMWVRNSSGGLYGDYILMYTSASGYAAAQCQFGGVNQVNIVGGSTISTGWHKYAFAYKQNDFAFYVDGVLIGTDSSGSVPTCNEVYIDQYIDGVIRNTSKRQAVLFPTRLTNAELASLTTL
jgi:hypothetical protein